MPGVISGSCGDCLTGVSLVVLSSVWLSPPGVKVGLKDTERFAVEGAVEGTINFCTGGRFSTRFFLACIGETSRVVPSKDAETETDGILFASARGLDMRSKDCSIRRAFALVTPHG